MSKYIETIKEVQIPDGFEAKIEGNKVVFVPKESEDERIMQCIEVALTDVDEQRFKDFGTTLKECLAYLEKQKPAEWSEEDRKMLDSIINVLEVMPSANFIPIKRETMIPWLESLSERFSLQPKQELSEEDERMRQTAIEACKTIAEKYELSGDRFYKCKDWLEYRFKSLPPQSKQAWSEEDERIRKEIVKFIKDNTLTYTHSGCEIQKRWIDYLENQKEQKEQKPTEWSEEDKHCIHQLILFCENCMQQDSEAIRCSTWLKSLRPQPHWKPSEEQIKVLDIAIRCGIQLGTWEEDILRSLLNDLKNYSYENNKI